MHKHQKYTGRQSKHERDSTPLQILGGRRNWANGVMIGGMIGGLRYLNRMWKLDQGLYERAVWALECLQIDIDGKWYDARVQADLEKANAHINGGNNAQQREQHQGSTGVVGR